MVVFVTCQYEEDPIKNEGARVLTRLHRFFRCSRACYSAVLDRIELKFELIQAFMSVLVICRNYEDPIKNEEDRVLTTFLPLYVYGNFFYAQGQLTSQSLVESGHNSNSFEIL